ncbi:hypothetical protein [Rhodopirellula sallentina]|nr:hypothetical protein [Rhodopirellula sallentina]
MGIVAGTRSFASEIVKLPPLADVPTENREHALVVALITNDVSSEWQTRRGSSRSDRAIPQHCWCAQFAEKSIANLPSGFLHPSAPIYFQHWPLGLPAVLTGGKKSSEPGRAFVVITDGQYRVLELSVGVPDGDDLSRMIGDAEDTRMWIRQFPDHPKEFVEQIADRNRERVTRIWRLELERQLEVLATASDEAEQPFKDSPTLTEEIVVRLGPLADQLQNVYLKDVQMRFGLTEKSDLDRLVVLEQHSATRMPWASTIGPFVAGADLRKLYVDLTEIIWSRSAMQIAVPGELAGEPDVVADWVSQQDAQAAFTFELTPPLLSRRGGAQRIPVSEVARRHRLGWDDLDAEIEELPILRVSNRDLAKWLIRGQRRPVDISRPSHARHLFFRSAADHPYPIRDGEAPGPTITMIRKVQR